MGRGPESEQSRRSPSMDSTTSLGMVLESSKAAAGRDGGGHPVRGLKRGDAENTSLSVPHSHALESILSHSTHFRLHQRGLHPLSPPPERSSSCHLHLLPGRLAASAVVGLTQSKPPRKKPGWKTITSSVPSSSSGPTTALHNPPTVIGEGRREERRWGCIIQVRSYPGQATRPNLCPSACNKGLDLVTAQGV